jgi:general stress protein YciG
MAARRSAIRIAAAAGIRSRSSWPCPKANQRMSEDALSTPVPANTLPGARGVVELGDVVKVSREPSSLPIFRHNGRAAEMVLAELAGAYEAPLYGMLAVQEAMDKVNWNGVERPKIALHGQPQDESKPVLLWDGEWEVTWVTFRDMGAAFMVALVGIYILVVAQFGSFKLPLVILTPIPLTFIGIMIGHWLFNAAFTATSMIGFIALAGIIVRNSILLVDFIRNSRSRGQKSARRADRGRRHPLQADPADRPGGDDRRGVILADPIFQGLAISLLFGLASSTALTAAGDPGDLCRAARRKGGSRAALFHAAVERRLFAVEGAAGGQAEHFRENRRRRAEAGESGLQHVEPDESRQRQPIGRDEPGQSGGQKNHHASKSDHSAVDTHGNLRKID